MYGGDASDYYRDLDRRKEEAEKQKVKDKLVHFGYKEHILNEYETYQLNLIYNRILEIKKQKHADELILKLHGEQG